MAIIKSEVDILKSVEHPYIVRCFDAIDSPDKMYLVMEMCAGPNLQYVLRKRGALELAEAANILRQCVSALAHLHELSLIHI